MFGFFFEKKRMYLCVSIDHTSAFRCDILYNMQARLSDCKRIVEAARLDKQPQLIRVGERGMLTPQLIRVRELGMLTPQLIRVGERGMLTPQLIRVGERGMLTRQTAPLTRVGERER